MTAPARIRLSRAKGWRKPEGAVVVARPSKWGNPFVFLRLDGRREAQLVHAPSRLPVLAIGYLPVITADPALRRENCAEAFRMWIECDRDDARAMREAAAIELRGRPLCCWCPLDAPCHADVLLEIANR